MNLTEGGIYTPSGGTTISLTLTGKQVVGGGEYINSAETDFFARESMIVSYKPATVDSKGAVTKSRCSLAINRPKRDTDTGEVMYNVGRIQLEIDPISGIPEADNIRLMMISALNSASMVDFWRTGTKPA